MLSLTILAATLPAPLYPTPDEIYLFIGKISVYIAAGALLIVLVSSLWPEKRRP